MASIIRTIREVGPKPLAVIGLECKKHPPADDQLSKSSSLKLSSSAGFELPKKKDTCPKCNTLLLEEDLALSTLSRNTISPTRRPSPGVCHVCTKRIDSQELKWVFNDYHERQKIGQGQFSIYKGVLVTLGREKQIAVKVFGNDEKDDFEKERDIQCKLHHPNIVNLIGHCEKDGLLCLLVPFKEGGDLSRLIHDPSKSLSAAMAVAFAEDVCRALKYLHARNIIHRDLKPGNILLNRSQTKAYLTDFGTTRQIANHMTTFAVGTLQYLAPEVFTQSHYHSPVDIYSFAIIMWEMLTRTLPWSDIKGSGFSLQLEKKLQGLERLPFAADFDPLWRETIEYCWAQDPNERPTADALLKGYLSKLRSRLPSASDSKVSIGTRRPMSILRPIRPLGYAGSGAATPPTAATAAAQGGSLRTGSPGGSFLPLQRLIRDGSSAPSSSAGSLGSEASSPQISPRPGHSPAPVSPRMSPTMSPAVSPRGSVGGWLAGKPAHAQQPYPLSTSVGSGFNPSPRSGALALSPLSVGPPTTAPRAPPASSPSPPASSPRPPVPASSSSSTLVSHLPSSNSASPEQGSASAASSSGHSALSRSVPEISLADEENLNNDSDNDEDEEECKSLLLPTSAPSSARKLGEGEGTGGSGREISQ